ncbi:MAG TPA: hypothetical protein V6D17_22080 [Candidatus Obscuribacterales bacterium]
MTTTIPLNGYVFTTDGSAVINDNGTPLIVKKHHFAKTKAGDTIINDGANATALRARDLHRAYYLRPDGTRDYDSVKCTPQPQLNWMGNKRPSYTTNPKLRRGRYQGSDVAVYSTIFGDAIDWVETRRGNFGGC